MKELVRNLEDAYRTGMAAQNDLLKAQVKQNEEMCIRDSPGALSSVKPVFISRFIL